MKIEEKVDRLICPQKKRSRQGIGMQKRAVIGVFVVLGILLTVSVSAVLLDHFGEGAKAELDIKQSVVVNALPWEESHLAPGETFVGIAGCCYGLKDKIENRGCVGGRLLFEDEVLGEVDPSEVIAYHYVIPGWTTLILENKDTTTWQPIEDEIWATVSFNPCCPEFTYEIEVYAAPEIEYGLIYYADQGDRFNEYGGSPLVEIFTFTTDPSGYYTASSSVELDMYFPVDGDWNIGPDADYSQSPDNYIHAKGAKLWIVPTTCYDSTGITCWAMQTFLFETDLVVYFDCDIEPPQWAPEVLNLEPETYYDIAAYEEICLITYWCVDWASSGGLFNVKTYISPVTTP